MQWFRLTVENRRNVTKFQKALSFLAELREYHHTYIYKLVKSTTSLVMHIISVDFWCDHDEACVRKKMPV